MPELSDADKIAIEQVVHNFTNHPPVTNDVALLFDEVTARFIVMGEFIVLSVPAGRERALALTNLEQCSMFVKAGIARHQPPVA